MWPEEGRVYITGYSKLPQGISAAAIYEVMVVGIEMDARTLQITDVEFSLALPLSNRVLKKIMVGKNFEKEMLEIVEEIKKRYHGSAQKSIIAALRSAYERFMFCRKEKSSNVRRSWK